MPLKSSCTAERLDNWVIQTYVCAHVSRSADEYLEICRDRKILDRSVSAKTFANSVKLLEAAQQACTDSDTLRTWLADNERSLKIPPSLAKFRSRLRILHMWFFCMLLSRDVRIYHRFAHTTWRLRSCKYKR